MRFLSLVWNEYMRPGITSDLSPKQTRRSPPLTHAWVPAWVVDESQCFTFYKQCENMSNHMASPPPRRELLLNVEPQKTPVVVLFHPPRSPPPFPQ